MVNIITVDGPAGVGKGTICKLLAKVLDAKVLNSGEIFRSVSYYLKKNNVVAKLNLSKLQYLIEKKIPENFTNLIIRKSLYFTRQVMQNKFFISFTVFTKLFIK